MFPSPAIRRFLDRARRRLRVERGLRTLALVSAATTLVLLLAALAAARSGPAAVWPVFTTRVLPAVTLSIFALVLVNTWRTTRSDTRLARLLGRAHPPIASDLLSAIQLADGSPSASPALRDAFLADLEQRLHSLPPERLLPLRRARRALATALLLALGLAGLSLVARDSIGRGLALLLHVPSRFEGALVSDRSLVGDLRITYTYPAYTRLPDRTIEGSSGDLVAPRGTRATLRMRALRSARRAIVLLGERGDEGEVEARVRGEWLEVELTLRESTRYRMWLAPLIGRPLREDRGHRIEVQPDQAPVVEIRAAADRIELPAPRPIEIAYGASDDYGLGAVDLVYRVGGGPDKRLRLEDGAGRRTLEGKTVWDASREALTPGVEIAYRIEARDQDSVLGSKAGSSRTLYLVLERPRESHDESIEEQRRVLERLLAVLADRLELDYATGIDASQARGPHAASGYSLERLAGDPQGQLQALQGSHESELQQVVSLGRLVDRSKRGEAGSATLLKALSGIADRLNRHLREESDALHRLRDRALAGELSARELIAFHRRFAPHVAALEEGCLLLDDLIGRQRLEDLAALGQQLRDAHARMTDLLARYRESKDEALREQLLAEMAQLKQRIADLAAKLEAVRQRNELPTEWQNLPDLRRAMADARRVEEAARRGDADALEQALAELGKQLESLQSSLDGNAEDFNAERFPRESRALADLSRQISELESDQRLLTEDTQSLARELDSAMDGERRQRLEQALAELDAQLAELGRKVAGPAPRQAGERADDALARAREHVERTRQLLSERDLAEAGAEAAEARRELQAAEKFAQRRAGRDGPGSPAEGFAQQMGQAAGQAGQIAETLGQLIPQSSEVASGEQRERAGRQGDRQGGIEQRTRELGQHAGREGEGLSAFERARGELEAAAEQMRRARQDLQSGRVREALAKEQAAAERLSALRESLRQERLGGGSESREPVPIPGARQAPRAWREELMEAMRERAPEAFREEVRRYYEELVR